MNPLSRLNNAAPAILRGLLLACLSLAPTAQAADPPRERGRPTAILVSPIHEAQVADGTVVSVQDGKPDTTPNKAMTPKTLSDFGGNQVMLEIAPNVYAVYGHLQPGSLRVKVGDTVNVGATLAKIGNTGPSLGPHLHFGLLNRPDMFTGRSLPFVIDSYTLAGTVDVAAAKGDTLPVTPNSKQVRSVYPLYGSIQNFP